MSSIPFTPTQLILGAALGSFAIFANYVALIMVGKVNERVPETERISYISWSRDAVRRYRQLYPNGRLALLFRACEIAMVVGFIFFAYTIGR